MESDEATISRFAGDDGVRVARVTRRERTRGASASEGAREVAKGRRDDSRAAYLSSVSNAMVAVVARAPPLPRDSRNDSLGKSAPRVRCERRARGPVTAPNAPSARPLRASLRVSSSARAALPRPRARPRVPRATRPPRVTSKKTPRRVRNRAGGGAYTQTSLSEPSETRRAGSSPRKRRFEGIFFPSLLNQTDDDAMAMRRDSLAKKKHRSRSRPRVVLREENHPACACIHKKAS